MKTVTTWFISRNHTPITVYKTYNCTPADYMCYTKLTNGRTPTHNGGSGGLKKAVWAYSIEMLWFRGLFLVGKIIV